MSENFTNRELLNKAMPFRSLSRKEWNTFISHLEQVEKSADTETLKILHTLFTNQARIEVLGNYFDYYSDTLEEPVRDNSVEILNI